MVLRWRLSSDVGGDGGCLTGILGQLDALSFSGCGGKCFGRVGVLGEVPFRMFSLRPASAGCICETMVGGPSSRCRGVDEVTFGPGPRCVSETGLGKRTITCCTYSCSVTLVRTYRSGLGTAGGQAFRLAMSG